MSWDRGLTMRLAAVVTVVASAGVAVGARVAQAQDQPAPQAPAAPVVTVDQLRHQLARERRQHRVELTAVRRTARTGFTPQDNRRLVAPIARAMGLGPGQARCATVIFERESGFRADVWNHQGSGAYGIPQALPARKMASAGGDWRTNPATQIVWGLDYMRGRYGSPCGALAHWNARRWY